MAEKVRHKILDLLQVEEEIEVAPGKMIAVRPINLDEMMSLFVNYQDAFIVLYNKAVAGTDTTKMDLAPFLAAAPDMVATIIAIATDSIAEEGAVEAIRKRMAATVQLIAVERIWKLSVPDPKKASELLSGVMARLRKLTADQKAATMALAGSVTT